MHIVYKIGDEVLFASGSAEAMAALEEAFAEALAERERRKREEVIARTARLEDLRAELEELQAAMKEERTRDAFPLPLPQAVEHHDPSGLAEVLEQRKRDPER